MIRQIFVIKQHETKLPLSKKRIGGRKRNGRLNRRLTRTIFFEYAEIHDLEG
jgi:hypothetical protein